MTDKAKTFDCVEEQRRGALRIHEVTKDMTLQQKIDYWHERSEQFRQQLDRSRVDDSTARGSE